VVVLLDDQHCRPPCARRSQIKTSTASSRSVRHTPRRWLFHVRLFFFFPALFVCCCSCRRRRRRRRCCFCARGDTTTCVTPLLALRHKRLQVSRLHGCTCSTQGWWWSWSSHGSGATSVLPHFWRQTPIRPSPRAPFTRATCVQAP